MTVDDGLRRPPRTADGFDVDGGAGSVVGRAVVGSREQIDAASGAGSSPRGGSGTAPGTLGAVLEEGSHGRRPGDVLLGRRSFASDGGLERDWFRDVESETGAGLLWDAGENCAHNRDNGTSLGTSEGESVGDEGFCKAFECSVSSPADTLKHEVTFNVGAVNGNSKLGIGAAIKGGTNPFGKPGKVPDEQGLEPDSFACEECVICGLGILTGPRTIFNAGK